MLVRYILLPNDHLAWYAYYVANMEAVGWSSFPFIGPLLAAYRRKCFIRGILAAGNRFALGERTLELSPSGVREFSMDFDFATAWVDVAHVAVTPQHLFLAHSSMDAYVIPLQYFESDALRDSFVSFALSHALPLPNS